VKQLLSLIFILNLLNARPGNLDSLLTVSAKLSADTERVNLFYRAGFAARTSDPEFSMQCATKACRFAERAGVAYYSAKAHNLMGILAYRKNDFGGALSHHKKALALRTSIRDERGMAMSQVNLANIYTDMGQYDLAETAYNEALKISSEAGDEERAGSCLLNLGVLNAERRNDRAARDYFEQARSNAAKRFDYALEALCLNNLSVINMNLGDYDQAIANCVNSIKVKDLMDNDIEKADSYLNLALAFLKKCDPRSALENLNIADSIISVFNYSGAKINALKIRSEYLATQNKYEEAYALLKRHDHLRDSLRAIPVAAPQAPVFRAGLAPEQQFEFPFFYLNILIVVSLLGATLLFKFKR
jgi:tetratricopeptide (TPR) repeat protein